MQNTLNRVRALSPDSLTVHSLAVKRAARLNMFKDKYQEMTFEESGNYESDNGGCREMGNRLLSVQAEKYEGQF